MSKPLNLKEHNQAFTRFLVFFLVTLAIAAGALYFNFQTPQKELEILRERSDLLRNQNLAQENYKRTLNEVMQIMSKLDSVGGKSQMIDSELKPKIEALRNANIDDSSSAQRLNMTIFVLVNKYRDAKFDFMDSKSCVKDNEDLRKQIVNLKENIEILKLRVQPN
jgi:Type VI secretion system, TssO